MAGFQEEVVLTFHQRRECVESREAALQLEAVGTVAGGPAGPGGVWTKLAER